MASACDRQPTAQRIGTHLMDSTGINRQLGADHTRYFEPLLSRALLAGTGQCVGAIVGCSARRLCDWHGVFDQPQWLVASPHFTMGNGLLVAAAWACQHPWLWRRQWTNGERGHTKHSDAYRPMPPLPHTSATTTKRGTLPPLTALLLLPYIGVLGALAVNSVSGYWPVPLAWSAALSLQTWQSVLSSAEVLWRTATLGLASAGAALCWAVAWMEWAPTRWQWVSQRLALLPLTLPTTLWVIGLHRLAVHAGIDATWAGVALAHVAHSPGQWICHRFCRQRGAISRNPILGWRTGQHGDHRSDCLVRWWATLVDSRVRLATVAASRHGADAGCRHWTTQAICKTRPNSYKLNSMQTSKFAVNNPALCIIHATPCLTHRCIDLHQALPFKWRWGKYVALFTS